MDVMVSILVLLGSKLLTYAAIGLFAIMAPFLSTVASAFAAAVILLIVVYYFDEDEKKEGNPPPASK